MPVFPPGSLSAPGHVFLARRSKVSESSVIRKFARGANVFPDSSPALALRFARQPKHRVSFGIGMDHDGPPIIPIRPISSDPPNIPMSDPPVS